MSRLIRRDKTTRKPSGIDDRNIPPLTSETIVEHLKACQTMADNHARQSFRAYIADVDEAFHVAVDNAKTNQEVAELSGFQRLFKRNRQELERYYTGYIGEGFVKFKKKTLRTDLGEINSGGAELSLVDNDELEEAIAISAMTQRVDADFAESIWALNQRLALLNDGEQVTEAGNPAAPIQFCESLRRALRLIPMSAKAKGLVYKSYEVRLPGLVRDVVEDINQYLKKAGVLPNLRYTPPRKVTTQPPHPATSDAHSGTVGESVARQPMPDPNQSSTQYQSSLVQAIRNLQHSMSGRPQAHGSALGQGPANSLVGGGAAPVGGNVVITTDQLLAALQTLQGQSSGAVQSAPAGADQTLPSVSVQEVLQALAQQLQTTVGSEQGEQVSSADMHTIDLVGLVFEYMLKDENVPDSIKALLSYMHTPFLKLAFIDPGFFEQPEHPARLLLNNLAEAGTRWVGNDGTVQHDMYNKIKEIVDRVLRDFQNDVRVMTEALLEFNNYTKNIVRRQELLEKRATEKAQGEERLREVKVRVNDAVRERTNGKELPSAVLLFVLQPWSDYLSFTLLRYGDKSDKWRSALSVVDDVLWAVEPKVEESDLIRQTALASSIIEDMQSGFDTIGYDTVKGRKLIEAIDSLIEMAQQSKKAEPAPAPMRDKLEKIAAEKAGQEPDHLTDISSEEARVVESLKMIEFGTWFEFEGGRRLKVAWYNARTSHYMLVDQMGRKVDVMSGLEIAREMMAKRAKIIAGSSKPFFERALENIFQKLNAQAEAQSGGSGDDK